MKITRFQITYEPWQSGALGGRTCRIRVDIDGRVYETSEPLRDDDVEPLLERFFARAYADTRRLIIEDRGPLDLFPFPFPNAEEGGR